MKIALMKNFKRGEGGTPRKIRREMLLGSMSEIFKDNLTSIFPRKLTLLRIGLGTHRKISLKVEFIEI